MSLEATLSSESGDRDSSVTDLFALSDEQILDITPETSASAPVGQPFLAVQQRAGESAESTATSAAQAVTEHEPRVTGHDLAAAKSAQPRAA